MDRISKFARPLGIAIAVLGVALVSVSAYYLFAYMQSGSDADEFNVDAAVPEQQLAYLGQGLPEPARRTELDDAVSKPVSQSDADVSGDRIAVDARDVAENAVSNDAPYRGSETVLISSVFAGLAPGVPQVESGAETRVSQSATDDFPFTDETRAGVGTTGEAMVRVAREESPSDEHGNPETAMLEVAADNLEADRIPIAPSMSTAEMLSAFGTVYPGGNMNPRYWSEPHWAGNLPFGGPTIPAGFLPVDASDGTIAAKSGSDAVRMRIPSIDLDASVAELEIIDLGDSRAWSTPDKIVGHIPTTANPGELANGWYFGHLDNFLSNEGDIFRRLPEIASMLKNEYVDIFIATNNAEYMYRVTGTRQVHRSDLYITESNNSQITLVTCWPFRVYDQRIVVSAVLIAVKPLQEV